MATILVIDAAALAQKPQPELRGLFDMMTKHYVAFKKALG